MHFNTPGNNLYIQSCSTIINRLSKNIKKVTPQICKVARNQSQKVSDNCGRQSCHHKEWSKLGEGNNFWFFQVYEKYFLVPTCFYESSYIVHLIPAWGDESNCWSIVQQVRMLFLMFKQWTDLFYWNCFFQNNFPLNTRIRKCC